MSLPTKNALTETIGQLKAECSPALHEKAIDDLTAARDVIEGFALIAENMGLSDILGLMRANLPVGEDAQRSQVFKMRKALDTLEAMGINTEEPDISTLFDIDEED